MAEWQDPQVFAFGLGIALLFVVLLVGSIIVITRSYIKRVVAEQRKFVKAKMEHQQELLWNSVRVQEKERNRIASDLHDELISKLTVLTYALQMKSDKVNPAELLGNSIAIARRITHDLRPPLLEQTTLCELIDDFMSPLKSAYVLDCHYSYCREVDLNAEVKLQLFRIVQEVINNALKHAKASTLFVRVHLFKESIALVVGDNGVGFDVDIQAKGLGLKNIELRAQLLKASWKFKSIKGRGSRFLLVFKIDAKS